MKREEGKEGGCVFSKTKQTNKNNEVLFCFLKDIFLDQGKPGQDCHRFPADPHHLHDWKSWLSFTWTVSFTAHEVGTTFPFYG